MRGYDRLAFAAAYPVTSITTVSFGLVCGDLIDRLGSLRLLPYFLLPLAIAAAVIGLTTPMWGVYLFMFLLGISNGFTSMLLEALWPEVYGPANLGGIRAIVVGYGVLDGDRVRSFWCSHRQRNLAKQMLWLSGWCIAACFVMAFAASRIRLRERGRAARKAAPA